MDREEVLSLINESGYDSAFGQCQTIQDRRMVVTEYMLSEVFNVRDDNQEAMAMRYIEPIIDYVIGEVQTFGFENNPFFNFIALYYADNREHAIIQGNAYAQLHQAYNNGIISDRTLKATGLDEESNIIFCDDLYSKDNIQFIIQTFEWCVETNVSNEARNNNYLSTMLGEDVTSDKCKALRNALCYSSSGSSYDTFSAYGALLANPPEQNAQEEIDARNPVLIANNTVGMSIWDKKVRDATEIDRILGYIDTMSQQQATDMSSQGTNVRGDAVNGYRQYTNLAKSMSRDDLQDLVAYIVREVAR